MKFVEYDIKVGEITANDCIRYLRRVKSTMPNEEVWEEWFARIKLGAEGKDDW